MLPHAFPFRLVEAERVVDGRLRVRISSNAARARRGGYPSFLAVEILAQAAFVLLAEDGDVEEMYLAGVERARFDRRLEAGDELMAAARLVGSFGDLHKIDAALEGERGVVATAELLVGSRA